MMMKRIASRSALALLAFALICALRVPKTALAGGPYPCNGPTVGASCVITEEVPVGSLLSASGAPSHVVIDDAGDFYAVRSGAGCCSLGDLVKIIPGFGGTVHGFGFEPIGLAFDPVSQNFYTAMSQSGFKAVFKIPKAGETVPATVFSFTSLDHFGGVAADAAGKIFATHTNFSTVAQIYEITPPAGQIFFTGGLGAFPGGMTIDGGGNFIVVGTNGVTGLGYVTRVDGVTAPFQIITPDPPPAPANTVNGVLFNPDGNPAVTPAGDIVVTNPDAAGLNSQILLVTPGATSGSGTAKTIHSGAPFVNPSGAAITPDGQDILVVDRNGTLFRISGALNSPPVAQCQNANVLLDMNGDGTLTPSDINNGSFDPDGDPLSLDLDRTDFSCPADLGLQLVTLTVTDPGGESDQCLAAVTVMDVTPPVITCPADVTLECPVGGEANADVSPSVTGTATAVDNCGIPSIGFADVPVGDCGTPTGFRVSREWTATDTELNASQCTATITVRDTTAPITSITSAVDGNAEAVLDGGSTLSTEITISFSGDDQVGVTGFECQLDGSGFVACTSSASFMGLATAPHTFQVRALDGAGNTDASPATHQWTIFTSAQATQNLIVLIQRFSLQRGTERALLGPLKNIEKKLTDQKPQNDGAVCGKLDEFLVTVNEKEAAGKLTTAQANELRQDAQAIKVNQGCP